MCLLFLPFLAIILAPTPTGLSGEGQRAIAVMAGINFLVIARSFSLADALVTSGAAAWFSNTLVGGVEGLRL